MQLNNPYLTHQQQCGHCVACWSGGVWHAITQQLSADQKTNYQNNGFLQIEQLFDQTEVDFLLQEMQHMREDFATQKRPEAFTERDSQQVRSIFNVHRLNKVFANLMSDERVLNVARELLGSEVYIHQSY